jgi:hypothetical protein
MKDIPTIMWEKWKDPFGIDDQLDSDTDDDYIDSFEEENYETQNKKIKCQIIATPFGIIPINENTASGSIFNFWNGHTNFAITKGVAKIIENTIGVETINIFTKYRFRIAIGKAFSDSKVMRQINNNVYNYIENSHV